MEPFSDRLASLADLSDEELTALEQEMVTAFDAADESGDVDLMQQLADAIDSVRSEQMSREGGEVPEAAAEEAPPVAASAEGDDGNGDAGDGEDEDPGAEVPEPDVPAEAPDQTEEEGTVEVTADDVPAENQHDVLPLAASYTITAGGDIPGLTAGTQLADIDQVVEAMTSKINAQRGIGDGEYVVVASFRRDPETQDENKLLRVGDAPGNSRKIRQFLMENPTVEALVAAGWCAPKTPIYDFTSIGSTATPVKDSLATFGVDRGGIIWQEPASLASIPFTGTLFSRWVYDTDHWEAQDMAGTALTPPDEKPCVMIECGTERSAELEALPLCLCFDNMTVRANPEWVRHTTDLVMVAQARYTEQLLLLKMFTAPGVVNTPATVGAMDTAFGAARDLLVTTRLVAAQFRWRNRLDANQQLRVYMPAWTRDAIACDLAIQIPGDDTLSVSRSEVDQYLADANLSPVWYIDDIPATTAATAPITADAAFDSYLGFPKTAEWLITLPGVFTRLDGGSLDLGIVRTKEDVQKNKYCEFAETFEDVAYMGPTDPDNAWAVRGTTAVTVRGGFAPAVATVPAGGVIAE